MDKIVYYYTQNSDDVSHHDITTIVTTFYFFRMHIYAGNTNQIDAKIRAVYIWTLTLWLLAISSIFETTRRNVISEAIALMLLVLKNGVFNPRALTSQPSEHNFGFFRSIIRQFTVIQFIKLVKQIKQRIYEILKGDLQTVKGRNKGHLSTLGSNIKSNIESFSKDY